MAKISCYPPFEDLVNFAKQETVSSIPPDLTTNLSHDNQRPSSISLPPPNQRSPGHRPISSPSISPLSITSNNFKSSAGPTSNESNLDIILSTKIIPGNVGGSEIRLQILLEEKEETITIICDFKDKVQALYRCLFEFLEIKHSYEDAYALFHPTQRQRIPPYVTIKSLNVSSGDLLIFKNLIISKTPKKKSRTKNYKNFLRKSNKPRWITTKDSNSLENDHSNSYKPYKLSSITTELLQTRHVEISIIQNFISWLNDKNGMFLFFFLLCKI